MIRGEHVFTEAVRTRWRRRIAEMANKLEKRAALLREVRERIPKPTAKSTDLVAWIRALRSARGTHMADDYIALDKDTPESYAVDYRGTCMHCKTKQHGGVSGLLLSYRQGVRRADFHCWKDACQRAYDRAIAADKRKHPELYAASARASERRREREAQMMRKLSKKRVPHFVGVKRRK